MRLIDADAFIGYLKELIKGEDTLYTQITEKFINMVEIMAENEPKNQWITCSERPPNTEVLCCDKWGEMIIAYVYADTNSDTGFSAESEAQSMYGCVAWMPLPESYMENTINE